MPPYAAAVVTGAEHVLEDIAPSFASAIAKIRKREREWILESTRFSPYESNAHILEAAITLVSQIHQVLALYLSLYDEPLSIRSIIGLTDDDKLIGRGIYATMKVNVFMPAGQVLNPTASGSLGTVVLSRSATDPAITEALSLVGHQAPTWGQVYDIIEFLGGERSIEKSGFARRSETRRVRHPANHYRHLDSPTAYPLPQNPPTFNDATRFAKGLLKNWIDTRV
jgi:hypothetical protein